MLEEKAYHDKNVFEITTEMQVKERILNLYKDNPEQEGFIDGFKNSTQIALNEFYYQRVWITYGNITFLLIL